MDIETDVAAYLATSGIGTVWTGTTGTIFITQSQDSPDDQVTVRAYGGRPSDIAFGPVDALKYPRVSIEARATTTTNADSKIKAIRALFPANFSNSGRTYFVRPVSEPIPLGPDETKRRWRVVCNFEAAING